MVVQSGGGPGHKQYWFRRSADFPQTRVSDHRIGLTLHQLPAIMEGDLDEMIEALTAWDQSRKLAETTA